MNRCPYCNRELGYVEKEYIEKKKWVEALDQEGWNYYLKKMAKLDNDYDRMNEQISMGLFK